MVAVQFIFVITLLNKSTPETKALYDASRNYLGVNKLEDDFISKAQERLADKDTLKTLSYAYSIGNIIKNQQLNVTWTF